LEVQEILGTRYPAIEKRVGMITGALNNIFEREHTLSLDRLKTVSKKDARQFLREIPGVHPFVEAYVMLTGFDASAVPMDDVMANYLKNRGALEDSSTVEEAQRFVENQLKAEESWDFFTAVRRASLKK
jgi:hypothetical protein